MKVVHGASLLALTFCAGTVVEARTLIALNETWETSPEVSLTLKESWEDPPANLDTSGYFIHGDSGYWGINDTAGEFGLSPNKVEVIPHEGSKALRLLSNEENDGSANNVWVDIIDLFSHYDSRFSGIEIPVTADTQIKFKEQGSMAASESGDHIRLSLVFNNAQVLHYVTQRHPNFQMPGSLLGQAVLLSTSGGVYFRNVFEDYNARFGSVPGNLKINEIVIENAFGSATGWSIWDDIQIGSSLTPPASAWYSSAFDLGNGWRWLEWFGSFNVSQEPWIYHAEHGWLFSFVDGSESVYFWDSEMESILWTSETVYPALYRFSDGQWLFYLKGSSNPRWFVNLLTGQWESW